MTDGTNNGMKFDTVIYDFDGTVMDTNNVVIQSWQHTFRELTGCEGPLERILATFGEPLEISMAKMFPDIPVDESVETYRDWHRVHFYEMIELFPGVKEMMDEVTRRGFKTGIATSRVAKTLYEGIEKFNIGHNFDEIVTVEEVTHHKPHPESVNVLLNKLGSVPEKSIMLGDSIFDILCAHNAGVTSVLVGWSATLPGKTAENLPPDQRPDYIIQRPEELFEIILK